MSKKKTRDLCYAAFKIFRDYNKSPVDKLNELYGIFRELEEVNGTKAGGIRSPRNKDNKELYKSEYIN